MSTEVFSRQKFLGPNSQSIISTSKVAIIGLGGGGSHIAQQLAHIGIGVLYLVDPQLFESPNMNRTVGARLKDIDKLTKLDIAARMVSGINPETVVIGLQCNWQEIAKILMEADIIVGCLDTFKDRNELEIFSRRYLIPYIDIGMDVHKHGENCIIGGQVITSIPGELCMRCMGFITDDKLSKEANAYGDIGPSPQVIWPNGVLASIAVGNVIKLITPWHSDEELCPFLEYEGNQQFVNASNLYKLNKGKKCSHFNCSTDLGDPFFTTRSYSDNTSTNHKENIRSQPIL